MEVIARALLATAILVSGAVFALHSSKHISEEPLGPGEVVAYSMHVGSATELEADVHRVADPYAEWLPGAAGFTHPRQALREEIAMMLTLVGLPRCSLGACAAGAKVLLLTDMRGIKALVWATALASLGVFFLHTLEHKGEPPPTCSWIGGMAEVSCAEPTVRLAYLDMQDLSRGSGPSIPVSASAFWDEVAMMGGLIGLAVATETLARRSRRKLG